MDWQTFIFTPESHWIKRLEQMALKRFHDRQLADQAFEECLAKLSANNWQRLSSFQGRSSPATFLICLFRNALEDFAIARFGKCRAPTWVQQLGAWWERIHKYQCCERREAKWFAPSITTSEMNEAEVLKIARILRAKLPNCGAQLSTVSLDAGDTEGGTLIERIANNNADNPADILSQSFHDDVLHALSTWLDGKHPASDKAMMTALSRIAASDEIRLIMRLIYQENYTLPKAAKAIGLAEHTARRQLNTVLKSIAEVLAQHQFNWQTESAT